MFARYLLVLAIAGAALAQQPARKWAAPRLPDGKPDLQGYWTNVTVTPLERPAEFANKPFLTKEEAARFEKEVVDRNNADKRGATAEADVGTAYNDVWYDRGTRVVPTLRSSLVIDPPDGRVPALTAAAQQRVQERLQYRRQHQADGPEDRSLPERCLVWPTAGPPMMPSFYNNNYQIIQAPGYVMIVVEMIHDVRVIPTDGRPHAPAGVRQWLGDSRGHWEGDTLVVDTTNFNEQNTFRGSSRDMHLIEKFTRAAPDQLLYEFTVDDPAAFTKQWTAQVPMRPAQGPLLEYACNEGNYAMEGMLKGARMAEQKAGK